MECHFFQVFKHFVERSQIIFISLQELRSENGKKLDLFFKQNSRKKKK